jgi:hypothetical protein
MNSLQKILLVSVLALGVLQASATGADGIPVQGPGTNHAVFAANDLGMHCTDRDFQVFSILPPFNVVHAQVVKKGTSTVKPSLLTDTDVDLYYAAASNANDPYGANSINTGIASGGFKTNFWDTVNGTASPTQTHGSASYSVLYPAGILDLFSPIPADLGLPVPDANALPGLDPAQQAMPSFASLAAINTPQKFARFYTDLAFFRNPLAGLTGAPVIGTTIAGVKWFAAEGVPVLPVDDAGRENPYPLMRVGAVSKGSDPTNAANVLASVDVVLPVASEADCQVCHAATNDPGLIAAGQTSNGSAADFADDEFAYVMSNDTSGAVPGPEYLLNAAKVNVLRLHDKKHGAAYKVWSGSQLVSSPCVTGNENSCLDQRRHIQCSQCHYTPALDLAQVGPIDEPAAGPFGRQQRSHISMSRAMHAFHGSRTYNASPLFPDMPAPSSSRTRAQVQDVLQQTCYTCHPGKRTACLRGAMAAGGVVCQDCHGNMNQVGNDFSGSLPDTPGTITAGKRIPWANEPKCQSCHVGGANSAKLSDVIYAADGIRLAQAYTVSMASQPVLANITAPSSRFAENGPLYRLSTGHGGLMCEACHGSTHAEWPNANPNANDNVAANQLQGHTGKIIECTVCHAAGSLSANLNGPHGLHPVADSKWVRGHDDSAKNHTSDCQACHGSNGQGSVLGTAAANRSFVVEGKTINIARGAPVSCNLCHSNYLSTGHIVTSGGSHLIVQSITFPTIDTQDLGSAPFSVTATANSGLSVNFASLTGTVCSVSGNLVTLLATGTCTLQASQSGNALYAAATPVSQSFIVQGSTGGTNTADVPIPSWALTLLAAGLLGTALQKLKRH